MEKLSVKERAKIQANLGAGKSKETKLLTGLKGQTQTLSETDLESLPTLFFKNCEDCVFVVDGSSVKFLVEGCKRCKITLNGHVRTEVVELWRSDGCELNINSTVKTLQLDLCHGLKLNYDKREHLGSIVWAGIYDFSLDVAGEKLETGYEQMKKEVEDLNDTTDQFIIRVLEGKLTQELVVRLPNGYPTTEREAKEFDERAERNAEKAAEFLNKIINVTEKEKLHEIAEKGQDTKTEATPDSTTTSTTTTTSTAAGGEHKADASPATAETNPGTEKEKEKEDKEESETRPAAAAAAAPKKKPQRVYINM
eukprot:TRINITY_DN2263_c0_g1_i3.p1 TRINITY_DN2263_c0_g1~~TRINITY_DN2263_c0_g1_i3.p1  ORF type:complete len:310 (-),score=84.73 TRINITY_DN2263_c0_g1_i3:25-954(-)